MGLELSIVGSEVAIWELVGSGEGCRASPIVIFLLANLTFLAIRTSRVAVTRNRTSAKVGVDPITRSHGSAVVADPSVNCLRYRIMALVSRNNGIPL